MEQPFSVLLKPSARHVLSFQEMPAPLLFLPVPDTSLCPWTAHLVCPYPSGLWRRPQVSLTCILFLAS